MKRWCLCRVVDDPGGGLTPKIGLHNNVVWRAWCKPGLDWCVAQFSTDSLATIDADAQIIVLPDATLDTTWGALPTNVRNQVERRIEDTLLSMAAFTPQATVREVLADLITQCQTNPNPGPDVGDVPEIG